MRQLINIPQNRKQIEHEGFYHGSQNCDSQDALAEIESHFNQKMETVSQEAIPRIKELEAVIEDAQNRLPGVQQRLDSIMARLGGHLPEIAVPCFMLLVGLFAMIAESAMLGPFMDLFDITDPAWQRMAAFAIGGACAIVLHLSIESLTPNRFHPHSRRLLRVLGVSCVVGLTIAGVARGKEAAYGAALNDSPLAGFLKSYPALGMLVYAFFTVAFPVAAALAIAFGAKAVREWREFLSAKHDCNHLSTVLARTPKELEGEQKKLAHERNKLEQQRKQWQNSYLVEHERGRTMGAAQTPIWIVWLKAAVAGLLGYLLAALACGRNSVYAYVTAAIAFIAAWVYFRHVWAHPKPRQLYNQQNVEFRNPGTSGGVR